VAFYVPLLEIPIFRKQMKPILNSVALLLITIAVSVAKDKTVIRVGHFPNITHAQGLVAHYLSRQGEGWFEARLGPAVEIQWFTYNAGPSAMEAIFAKSIELTYVGPRSFSRLDCTKGLIL
jgi:NitT/TauT family transport system substrate-binding protein